MPSELEDGKDVRTPPNIFISLHSLHWCLHCPCECMTGFCLSNAVHAKDNAEQQGRVEWRKHREIHKSPLLNSALF